MCDQQAKFALGVNAPLIGTGFHQGRFGAKPEPALGYRISEYRFWLGWAQEVAGDHAAAKATWQEARSELESCLKDQPENGIVMLTLALTDMGLGG